jgi:hypothetical protein
MAKSVIGTGSTANDGTGDTLRAAGIKINDNFSEMYTALGDGTAISLTSTAAELNILDGVTATAAELNILDGVTATAAELNVLDGITSDVGELNILDGVTATAAELNVLDGITADVNELNILDGVTATAAELNVLDGVPATLTATELGYVDGVTSSIQNQLDTKVADGATTITLTSSTAEPGSIAAGMFAVADGTTWDPTSKGGVVPYPVFYDGSAWNALY